MKIRISKYLLRLVFTAIALVCAIASSARRPDIVAVITVEGLSGDMLQSLIPQLTQGGFKRLTSTGATIDRIDYGPDADPAAATAILLTGAPPAVNGIPSARVYDTSTRLARSPLHDPTMPGNFTDETFSPAALKVSTLSDELRIATDGRGRAYAVAPRSYEAIIGAGHAGNGGYWIDGMTANWASTAYYKDMPPSVRDRNYRNPLSARLDTMKWRPLLNLSLYPGVTQAEIQKPFRTAFPRKDVQRVRRYINSPLSNTEITDVAIRLISETSLGKGKDCDMLTVSYTLPTAVSRAEVVDSYIRLDRDIARLLKAIEQSSAQFAVMLAGLPSADGASPDDKRWNIPSGLYSVKRALSLLEIQLMAVHGNGDWITGYHDRQFYLNRNLIKDRGLNLQDFRREVADFLGRMAGICNVVTIDDIISSRAGDDPAALKRNTSIPHAGDVIIQISPGWQIIDDGSGRASGVERHAVVDSPVFFIAPDMKRLQVSETIDARAIAPTLARLLQIRAPNGASLTPLKL